MAARLELFERASTDRGFSREANYAVLLQNPPFRDGVTYPWESLLQHQIAFEKFFQPGTSMVLWYDPEKHVNALLINGEIVRDVTLRTGRGLRLIGGSHGILSIRGPRVLTLTENDRSFGPPYALRRGIHKLTIRNF